MELLVVLDLVLFLEIVEDAGELFVAETIAKLLAALHEEHFVDDADHQLGRHLIEHLPQLGVVEVGVGRVEPLPHLAERSNLPHLQVGLREQLAVHPDEDLLDDFGAAWRREERQNGRDNR